MKSEKPNLPLLSAMNKKRTDLGSIHKFPYSNVERNVNVTFAIHIYINILPEHKSNLPYNYHNILRRM